MTAEDSASIPRIPELRRFDSEEDDSYELLVRQTVLTYVIIFKYFYFLCGIFLNPFSVCDY